MDTQTPDSAPKTVRRSSRQPRWKRWLKILGLAGLASLLALAAVVGAVVLRYRSIVHAQPGNLPPALEPLDLGRKVNPFLGTGGVPWVCGNNSPAAMVPFGMVRLGPDTASLVVGKQALNTSGYYYGDDQLLGFSHTRLNGTGATDGGHFLVVPARETATAGHLPGDSTTRFSHREEVASPGYYAVRLPELQVLAELTATPRVGVHRYTFHGRKPAHLRVHVSNALGGRRSAEGRIRVNPERHGFEGQVRTFGTFASRYGGIRVYFAARFDQPFQGFNTWDGDTPATQSPDADGDRLGVDFQFTVPGETQAITLRLAISYVSLENARANLEAEASGTFEEILRSAQQQWEERLSTIRITGGSEAQQRIFYTSLFRVFQMPTVFQDASGDYLGFDRKVHPAQGFRYFTDLSLWDTFRSVHPLYTLIAPDDQRDMMVSLTRMLEQGGWLPRWPSGHGYSNSMLGTPADIVMAEAWLKGIRGFDVEAAYAAMCRTASGPVPPGSPFSGRQGITEYLQHGYCPSGLVKQSVSRTFEFAWADRAISHLAAALGRDDEAELYRQRSESYRNLWNPATQHFQPRDQHGVFFEPFKPLLLTYLDRGQKFTRDYVEGSALQWRWAAPFDAEGMIALFQSREFFVEELDRFFARSSPARGAWNPGPYYWHGNQPDLHAAYLFNSAGRPDLTQKWVRWILENKYANTYDGLDGNDDGGTLSAWYVLSALGFYPVAGSDRYELGIPLFERAEVKLGRGVLTIEAENFGPGHDWVEEVRLNGTPLDRRWIGHAEIPDGGTLQFRLGRAPVPGTAQANE